MINISNMKLFKTRAFLFGVITLALLITNGCKKNEINELYHKFPDKTWHRFNLLSFEVPIKDVKKPYDVYLFARFTPDFQYNTLNFNMIMNTPGGEERIKEYQLDVKSKADSFLIECKNDSCEGGVLLKRELYLSKQGILKIEIENLTPRMVTEGVMGIGIRVIESGK
jgi:gliding motility-associated lipoprotein GldH